MNRATSTTGAFVTACAMERAAIKLQRHVAAGSKHRRHDRDLFQQRVEGDLG